MRQVNGVGDGESAEREVAGANVNVELVPAAPTLLEGSEQSAMGFGEGRGLQVAGHNRTVVSRIADGDGQVAGEGVILKVFNREIGVR